MPTPRYQLLLITAALCAPAAAAPADGLADYTLEELSQIVVSSVARQEASLASAAVSIQRISRAEIRRSGAATLPEALRLASHLHVARINSGNYSITARGFSAEFENKMLVMIDGRSVYSPLFSGVFWDVQDVLLEDVERIEVISGPGSTIWGTNAVNGVINVITRKAQDSAGTFAGLAAGNDQRTAEARYGAVLPNGNAYRIYARYATHDDLKNESGEAVRGRWHHRQAGFRTDFGAGPFAATVAGDVYSRNQGAGRFPDMKMSGGNLIGRLERKLADGSALRLQAYVDHATRAQMGARDRIDIADFELQHDFRAGERHALSWGGGYRVAHDRVENGPLLRFIPDERTLHWSNVFVQDQIALTGDLQLTLGTRFEQTSYTDVEWLPTARLAWQTPAGGLWWLGAARTVRAPSRFDRELSILSRRSDGTVREVLAPNQAFRSELARVAELGHRGSAGPFQYSVVAYRTDYDDLRSYAVPSGGTGIFTNEAMGRARGIELHARWTPSQYWQLTAGAVVQDIEVWSKPGSGGSPSTGNDPSNYWRLHSAHNLGRGIELDLELRHVSRLPQPAAPSYHELDARLAWHLAPGLEASVTGRNLLHSAHPEFGPAATRQLVGRSVQFQLSWRY